MTASERTVADIPDSEHVERAVRNAHHKRGRAYRWVHVQAAFALGSTFSQQMCRRFGLDPWEECGVESAGRTMTDAERKVVRACVDALRAYSPIRIVSAPNDSFELIVQHGETGREHSLAGCSNRMYAIALAAVLNKARAEALLAEPAVVAGPCDDCKADRDRLRAERDTALARAEQLIEEKADILATLGSTDGSHEGVLDRIGGLMNAVAERDAALARAEALHAGRASEPRADDPERAALADVASLVCGKDDDWDRDEVWRRVRDGLAERDRLAVAVVEARKEAGKWRDAALVRAEQAERLFTDAANERDRLAAELATARAQAQQMEKRALAYSVGAARLQQERDAAQAALAQLQQRMAERDLKHHHRVVTLEAALAQAQRERDEAREGPQSVNFCLGCRYYRSTPYQVQGDSGYDRRCLAVDRDLPDNYGDQRTPSWCPYLAATGGGEVMDNDFVWSLLTKLAREGGCIVSSADCDVIEIADAQARGDFLVDNRGYGWVRRLPEWLQRHSRFARNASPDCCEGPQPAARGEREKK